MKLFALNASRPFGTRVASALDTPLAEHEEREFEDGEHKARPLTGLRGEDVFVLQSLHSDPLQSVNERLVRLLFFLATVRQAGAARVTAVIPYLAYARKDRQTQPRDPVTTRYLAQLLEAVGIDAVITLEVHNLAAFQNAFRCQAHPLDTRRLFADHIRGRCDDAPVVVASPDPGGVKRVQRFRETLAAVLDRPVGTAFVEKRRSEGVVSGEALVGDVAGATVWIMDDLISTGGTLARAAAACRRGGAARVFGLAAHGLFTGEAGRVLGESALERVTVTDTVPPERLDPAVAERQLEVVSAAPLFAEAIRRIHEDGSLTALLDGPG